MEIDEFNLLLHMDYFYEIAKFLPAKDVGNLSKCCKILYNYCQRDQLWMELVGREILSPLKIGNFFRC